MVFHVNEKCQQTLKSFFRFVTGRLRELFATPLISICKNESINPSFGITCLWRIHRVTKKSSQNNDDEIRGAAVPS